MTYPPQFDDNLLYPRILDLDKIDVLVEDTDSRYFNVTGLPDSIGFGKHYFNISYNDLPGELYNLRNKSEILFEAKDSNGTVIFTDVTPYKNISGEAVSYLWVKRDPLRTYKDIADGQGTLTIVGELDNVPPDWVGKYNVRLTLPINIRKEIPNKSPLLIQSQSAIQKALILNESIEADMSNANFNRSYLNISMSNLDTYGGKIDKVEVSYIESSSILSGSEYTILGSYELETTGSLGKIGKFENDVEEEYAQGLNPTTHFRQLIMPPIPHRTGSTFDGEKNQIKFQFKFLNAAGEYATAVDDSGSTPLIITSSYVDFAGPATVIQGDNNLIDGQVYIGNAIGTGIEVNASSSAYLRSIGYLGFESASAGTGAPGFIIYTGSILGQNTDEYANGGVGLELVQDADNYLKFNTADSSLDIHTEKFFIGGTGQFVSGANSNIEISSSNFHLARTGEVIMSGTISASAGNIGGWDIGETSLAAASMSINSLSSSIFKVGSGSEAAVDAGNDQRYFIDFTPEDQSAATKHFVRFGPNFAVSQSGQLIASGAIIEGILIADDGKIGGWNILTGSLYAQPTEEAYVGMSAVGDTAFFASASSLTTTHSAAFNVKMNGDITASAARIDGTSTWQGTVIEKDKVDGVTGLMGFSSSVATFTSSINSKTGSFETGATLATNNTAKTGSFEGQLTSINLTTGSLNTKTGSIDTSIGKINATTGSLNVKTGSIDAVNAGLQVSLNKVGAVTSSLNTKTGSIQTDLNLIHIKTGSVNALNTKTGSIDTEIAGINVKTGSIDTLNVKTGSFEGQLSSINTKTGSLETKDTTLQTDLNKVHAATGSLNTKTGSIDTSIGKINATTGSLNTKTGSFAGQLSSINTKTGSLESKDTTLQTDLNKVHATTGSLNTKTGSIDTSIGKINVTTGSLNTKTGSIDTSIGKINATTGSLNTKTGSFAGQLSSINTKTGSLESKDTALQTDLNKVHSTTGSLNTKTGSVDTSLGKINATTGSLNTKTGSLESKDTALQTDLNKVHATTGSLNTKTGSLESKDTALQTDLNKVHATTGSLNTKTGSLETKDTALQTDLNKVHSTTGSLNTKTGSIDTSIGKINATTGSLNTKTGSFAGQLTSLNLTTGSLNTKTGSFASQLTSINAKTGGYSDTSTFVNTSADTWNKAVHVDNLNTKTGSVDTTIGKINATTGSLNTKTGSLQTDLNSVHSKTGSFEGQLTSINLTTGSLNTKTGSIESSISSINTATGSLKNANLRGHWTFNDTRVADAPLDATASVYRDVTGNGNDIAHEGVAWKVVDGAWPGSSGIMTVDNGGADILKDADVNSESNQSYTMWIKPTGVDYAGGDARILSRDWSAYFAWLETTWTDGKADLRMGRSDDYVRFTDGLVADTWCFAAMTLNYNTMTGSVYLWSAENSSSIGFFDCGTNPSVDPDGDGENVNSVAIGINSDDDNVSETSDNWSGSFDDIRYYNKTLTTDEVHTIYRYGKDQQELTVLNTLLSYTSSLNTKTGSLETDLDKIHATTGSLNTKTGSIDTSIGKINTTTGSLNTKTGSFETDLGKIHATTASLNTKTGSIDTSIGKINTTTGSLNTKTGSIDTSLGKINATTGSLNTKTGSLESKDTALQTDLNKVHATTGSLNTKTGSLESKDTALQTDLNKVHATTGSLNTKTGSLESKDTALQTDLNKVHATTGSLNTKTGSLETKDTALQTDLNKVHATTGSLNTKTGSIDTTIGKINATTGSLNTKTGSLESKDTALQTDLNKVHATTGSLNTKTGSLETKDTALQTDLNKVHATTGSLNTKTGSLESKDTALQTDLNKVHATTGSLNTKTGSIDTSIGKINTTTGSLNTKTGSIDTSIGKINATTGSLNTKTGSIDTSIGKINATTGSLNTKTGSLQTDLNSVHSKTGSFEGQLTSINSTTGSLNTKTGSIDTSIGKINSTTGSLNTKTGSIDTSLAKINTTTGSLNTKTGSLETDLDKIHATTGSLNQKTGSLESKGDTQQISINKINATTQSLNDKTASQASTLLLHSGELTSLNLTTGSLNTKTGSYETEFTNIKTGSYHPFGGINLAAHSGSLRIQQGAARTATFIFESASNNNTPVTVFKLGQNGTEFGPSPSFATNAQRHHEIKIYGQAGSPSMSLGTQKDLDGVTNFLRVQGASGRGYELNAMGLRQESKGDATDPTSYIISSSAGGQTSVTADRVGDSTGNAYFLSGKIYGTFVGQDSVQVLTSSYDSPFEGAYFMQTGSDNINGPRFPITLAETHNSENFSANDGVGILFKLPLDGETFQGGNTNNEEDEVVSAGAIAVGKFNDDNDDPQSVMNFYVNPNDDGPASFGTSDISLQISGSDLKVKKDIVGFVSSFSDERLKENIKPICSSIDIVTKLEGKTFNWNETSSKAGEFNAGMIAQDVEKILPHIVTENSTLSSDNTKYKSIKYQEIVPYLVEAIKEQQKELDLLKRTIKKLERKSKKNK